ncbi:hypothetical protein MA16_Dca001974 [Dendrobium catenatum]|uniref:Uncharacterized protein n=1 Tax=Dendrobium catenatum TaxID=906689 RepID=A0A2I0XE18_9ASPA|nr:hypothetical protein MA16_Dca001974 [Dendrobium catenatum]
MEEKKEAEQIKPKKVILPKSFKEALSGSCEKENLGITISSSSVNGIPAILVSENDLKKLAEPYKFALVGKFSFRRPLMEEIRKFFHDLHLTGMFLVTLLDARHVFINLSNELDYSIIFLRISYFVRNCQMRLLK